MAVERAQKIIDQAAEERTRFIEWVRGVPHEVWANTSPDGTWQARDYVAHLASIDPLLTAWFRSLQRERSERGTGDGGQRFDIDEWNERQILERRGRAFDELLADMEKHRVDLNAALDAFTDEQLDQTIHFGGDAKRSPRELPLHMFLSGWAYHDRWHMEDARRAIAGAPEQPFGDASFEQAMQGRGAP
jgi:hypothetical protein